MPSTGLTFCGFSHIHPSSGWVASRRRKVGGTDGFALVLWSICTLSAQLNKTTRLRRVFAGSQQLLSSVSLQVASGRNFHLIGLWVRGQSAEMPLEASHHIRENLRRMCERLNLRDRGELRTSFQRLPGTWLV